LSGADRILRAFNTEVREVVTMARRAGLLLTVVLAAAACSGTGGPGGSGGSAPTLPGLGGSPNPGTSTAPAQTLNLQPTQTSAPIGGNNPSFRPSGAQVRIANLYRDADGKGQPLDIYGDYSAQAGPMLVTVPYGTVSDWFDPGLTDAQGDMELSFYPTGKTTQDDQIGSQTETLKGTERITMAIATGDHQGPGGVALGQWKVWFENSEQNPLPTAPAAGQAVLLVDGIGLQAMPGSTETFVFVGVDGTCLPSVDQGPDAGGQPWGPGSQQSYLFPAGSHAVSLHLATPDCKAKSPYPDTTIDLQAGARAFAFYFTPDDKTLNALIVPLQ
jgi:hypothetical protein